MLIPRRSAKTLLVFALFLAALTSILWVSARLTGQRFRQESQEKRHHYLVQLLGEQIENTIAQQYKTLHALSRQGHLQPKAAAGPGGPAADLHLETAASITRADRIYIIDSNGIIVSCTQGAAHSILGENIEYRPYFRNAWQGRTTVFPAFDPPSGRMRLHFSTPVFGTSKETVDRILAMEFDIGLVEDLLFQRMEKLALASAQGIIFATNTPEWQYQALEPLTPKGQKALETSRQFGPAPIPCLDLDLTQSSVTFRGKPHYAAQVSMPISGWTLISLQVQDPGTPLAAHHRRLMVTGLMVTGGLALLAFFLLVNLYRQKQIQAELRQAREKYAGIFRNAVMGIYQSTLDGRFLDLNPAMAKILGFSSPEDLKKRVSQISYQIYATPADRDRFIRNVRSRNLVQGFETQFLRQDGTAIWVQLSGRIAGPPDVPEKAYLEGFCIDITDKKAAQEKAALRQRQLLDADRMVSMGVLASGVAHEINNPNTFIRSNAQFLGDAWKDAGAVLDDYQMNHGDFSIAGLPYGRVKEKLPLICDRIIEGSRRIARIIKELRTYSSKERSQGYTPVDLNQVIRSVLILLENMVKKATQRFSLDLADPLPPVMGNAQRLEQVFVNILQNSCQALENDHQAIWVSSAYDPDRARVTVICRDQGIGITASDLKQVMDPFFTTKRDCGGTGLGLSISSTIVQEMGGIIEIRSKPGQGTRVRVELPCHAPDGTAATLAAPPSCNPPIHQRRPE